MVENQNKKGWKTVAWRPPVTKSFKAGIEGAVMGAVIGAAAGGVGYGIGKAVSNYAAGKNILTGKYNMNSARGQYYSNQNAMKGMIAQNGKGMTDVTHALDEISVTAKRLGSSSFWENAGHSMMLGAYFGIQSAFGSTGNKVMYGGGMKNNTFGSQNNTGNKEVYDMGDWNFGGDKNDFTDWLWNSARKDRLDTNLDGRIYKIDPNGEPHYHGRVPYKR